MGSLNTKFSAFETAACTRRGSKMEKLYGGMDLLECFQNGLICDVTLIADDGKRISAHRTVLAAANEIFSTLLDTEPKEDGQREISIHGVGGDILSKLVEYCYTGAITIDGENIDETTSAAWMLRFTDIQEKCIDYYFTNLNAAKCLSILEMADQHNIVGLKETAHNFFVDNFVEVCKSDEFLQLSPEKLSALLKDDEMDGSKEEHVFSALMRWAKHDVENRKQSLEGLSECVRFQHIKNSVILSDVYQQCIDLNLPELYLTIVGRRRQSCANPRSGKLPNQLMIFDHHLEIEVLKYTPLEDVWTDVNIYQMPMCDFTVIYRDGKLIVIGGEIAENQTTKTVKSIDLTTFQVTKLPSMLSPRYQASAALLNDSIYVFGGSEGNATVCTVERFSFMKNTWAEVSPMLLPRRLSAHVILSGRLYVIGGKIEQDRRVNSVECYEPATNKWQTVPPMLHERSKSAAYALNGFIYVLGGYGKDNCLQSIERYNSDEASWMELEFVLPSPRYWHFPGFRCGDWIYLAGGCDGDDEEIGDFEKFNVLTGESIKLKDLKLKTFYCYLFKF